MPAAASARPAPAPTAPTLDVITIGRSSVDLYGQQVGGRLEDMASFSKAVGGCPTNIAIGGARLGLRTAVITRVGDEPMGRFIREELFREGVDTRGVVTDPKRLTALVILGVRDEATSPMIFYRADCADDALEEADIDEAFIASAAAIVVTGTHFSRANTAAAQKKAIRLAAAHGRRVAFDIDYRPNLWGLAGHDAGFARYVRSDSVTAHLQAILPDCDLVVGTEEEIHIAGGSRDTAEALRRVRALTAATIVLKRGPMGCVVFPGAIPASLEHGVKGPGFPVEVYNTLGAGDAFMAGFLRGWLRDEPLERACAYANAGGAFAVSRLLCSTEYPTWDELEQFLAHGSPHRRLRLDAALAHTHWATTRRAVPEKLAILSIDHAPHHLGIAADDGAALEKLARFKKLAVKAAARAKWPGTGMFLEGEHGREALFRAVDRDFWLARQMPGELSLPPVDLLSEWPVTQTVKVMLSLRQNRSASKPAQIAGLAMLARAARATRHELLVELLPAEEGPGGLSAAAALMQEIYAAGIRPDWWLLEPETDPALWRAAGDVARAHDRYCRGFLGIARALDSEAAFRAAKAEPLVKGFVGGRVIFGKAFAEWRDGALTEETAIAAMAARFAVLAEQYDKA